MSKILANSQSHSPTPSSVQHLTTLNDGTDGYPPSAGGGSAYATPAPEPQTLVVASSSTLDIDPVTVDDQSETSLSKSKASVRYKPFPDVEIVTARAKKRAAARGRSADEEDVMTQTATRFASRLAEDQTAVLYPDVDNPFTDATDAIRRLLPYHIFQHPAADLHSIVQRSASSTKGKSKATEEDFLREEIAETRFAVDCWRRRRALEKRFRRARTHAVECASPGDQAYILAQAVFEAERAETAAVNAELRAARAELDKLERERRAAPPPATPRQTTTYATQPSTPTVYTSQYRGYNYPYATPYGTAQYTLSPAFQTPAAPCSTTATSAAASTTPSTTKYPSAHGTPSTPASATPAQISQPYYRPHTATTGPTLSAIPVQLPVTHLPALKAIGLDPVPVASIPATGQARPAAVLKSQTATTLQIDINVGSLQPAQMNGLALILNTLTSRGVTVDGGARATSSNSVGNGTPTMTTAPTSPTASANTTTAA